MDVLPLKPNGFCAGVERAYQMTMKALEDNPGVPAFSLGLLVHNEKVISAMEQAGLRILDERNGSLEEQMRSIPDGSLLIYSAHGHDPKLAIIAAKKHLLTVDATCPFVKANMDLIKRRLYEGRDVIYVGKKGHLECLAALSLGERVYLYGEKAGDYPSYYAIRENDPVIVAQTTMDEEEVEYAVNDVSYRYPSLRDDGGRCPSTVLRQKAIQEAPYDIDLFVILGSERSNNTARLESLAHESHPRAQVLRVLDLEELKNHDLASYKRVALASGASTDPEAYQEVFEYLKSL